MSHTTPQCVHCVAARYTALERIVQVEARPERAAGTVVRVARAGGCGRDDEQAIGEKAIPVAMAAPEAAQGNRGSRAVEATAEQANESDVGDKWGADKWSANERSADKPTAGGVGPATKCGAMTRAPNRWKHSRRSIATRFQ